MAPKKKSAGAPTRLVYSNGAAVVVSAEKAERLVAGGAFTAETKASTSK